MLALTPVPTYALMSGFLPRSFSSISGLYCKCLSPWYAMYSPCLQPDLMYYWAHSEPVFQNLDFLPGKLSLESWPPERPDFLEGDKKEDEGKDDKRMAVSMLNFVALTWRLWIFWIEHNLHSLILLHDFNVILCIYIYTPQCNHYNTFR